MEIVAVRAKAIRQLFPRPWEEVRPNSNSSAFRVEYICKDQNAVNLSSQKMNKKVFFGRGRFIPFEKGGEYILYGHWKAGLEFCVEKTEKVFPEVKEDILAYLKGVGISALTAQTLWSAFGAEVFEVLDTQPQRLFDVPGLSKARAASILTNYQKEHASRDLFRRFEGVLPVDQARLIGSAKLDGAVSFLELHPHQAYLEGFIRFSLAEYIAFLRDRRVRLDTFTADQIDQMKLERAKAGLLRTVRMNEASGNTCMEETLLLRQTRNQLFQTDDTVDEQALKEVLDGMVQAQEPLLQRVRQIAGGRGFMIYTTTALRAEQAVTQGITSRLGALPVDLSLVHRQIEQREAASGFAMTDEQRGAVVKALTNRLSVITGGPGTGKTTIIQYIISLYANLHPEKQVLLCAPTGKAARRMAESTGCEASTIHTAFGLGVGKMEEGKMPAQSSADLVVVDESSMIDIYLMEQILCALKPEASLVLIGDANQLPSVGPGNILGDVIVSTVVPVSLLTQVKRQKDSSSIPVFAQMVLQQRRDFLAKRFPQDFQVIFTANERLSQQEIARQYMPYASVEQGNDVIVLSPMRKKGFGTGCEELNELLQQRRISQFGCTQCRQFPNVTFYAGDRIMQMENAPYAANGEVGDLIRFTDQGAVVDFGGGMVEVSDKELSAMSLAYATTVHKSQGSEYSIVIVSLEDSYGPLLQKNLLYTAITRAKEKVILIGSRTALEKALWSSQGISRTTQLTSRLQKACDLLF